MILEVTLKKSSLKFWLQHNIRSDCSLEGLLWSGSSPKEASEITRKRSYRGLKEGVTVGEDRG